MQSQSKLIANICCKCQRVRINDRWVRKEEPSFSADYQYFHTYCPSCLPQVLMDVLPSESMVE